jgi:hypothetical protein
MFLFWGSSIQEIRCAVKVGADFGYCWDISMFRLVLQKTPSIPFQYQLPEAFFWAVWIGSSWDLT